MKKAKKTIAYLCALLLATCSIATAASAVFSTPSPSVYTAFAEETASKIELISPPSYEEYLPLQNPSDVCASAQFTTIADGKTLYIYDKHADKYSVYTHDTNITKIQFDKQEKLYLLDDTTKLYTLHPSRLEKERTPLVCSTFLIVDTTLYFTNVSSNSAKIQKIELSGLSETPVPLVENISSFPKLAYEKGELYYTEGSVLRKVNPLSSSTSTLITTFPFTLSSIIVSNNLLFCTNTEGNFFVYNLHDFNTQLDASKVTPLYSKKENFGAISAYEKQIYAVDGKSVKRYSLTKEDFENYQITSSAKETDRIDGASAIRLSDNRLFIADNNNERISVYDTENKKFLSPIPMEITPKFLASNGESVLVASNQQILVYDLDGTLLFSKKDLTGDIVGATCVENIYYLVTSNNHFLSITPPTSDEEWTATVKVKSSTKYATLLSSDAYGKLYVRSGNSVYEYTKEEFLSANASLKEICSTLPDDSEQIEFDYSGNMYVLEKGSIHKFTKNATNVYEKAKTFAWSEEKQVCGVTPNPKAFALSITDDLGYVLDENDYIVKRTDLALPTLKNIPVNGADEQIFNGDYTNFEVVTIKPNALLVRFDFLSLKGATYYPYQSYKTSAQPTTAVRLAKSGAYDVLAVYSKTGYETYLTYSSSCEDQSTQEYLTKFAENEQFTAELTNAVGLYKFPFLSSHFAIASMERGSEVKVLGKVEGLNLDYYLVEYKTATGESKTGYAPCAYVSAIKGETPTQNPQKGKFEPDKGSIGRLIYLLLGFGVVCILTDYLILRKPKNKDE